MFTNGQTINYDKYMMILQNTPAPILADQLPDTSIDFAGLMAYARSKGVKAGDLTDEEKNRFIKGDTVESLQKKVKMTIKYDNISEWNSAIS